MPLPRDDESPEGFVLVLQAWDLAFTDDPKKALAANSSFNVGGTLAVDTRGHLHVCKGVRVRGLDPTELEELITAEAALLVPDVVVIESNHAGHVHAHNIAKKTGVRIVTRYTGGHDANKRDLYRGIPGMQHPFAHGQIHIWCGDEHNRGFAQALVTELHEFPNSAHDDTVMMLWHGWSAAFKAMVTAAQFYARGMSGEVRKHMRVGGR
jgi:phage terminase large subunit-like protein